jgi:hypothetical protein
MAGRELHREIDGHEAVQVFLPSTARCCCHTGTDAFIIKEYIMRSKYSAGATP